MSKMPILIFDFVFWEENLILNLIKWCDIPVMH